MKLVSKSIRDRVALIKWHRERVVTGGEGRVKGKTTKTQMQNLPQVPPSGTPQGGAPLPQAEPEEPEGEQVTLFCSVPTTSTIVTCKYLLFLHVMYRYCDDIYLYHNKLCLIIS